MEHLLSAWPVVQERLRRAKHILLLSDYDGTLTPIVEKPEMAIIPSATRRLLQSLVSQHHFTVGIISGRALFDLKEKVSVSGAIYAGNHGFEIEGPGLNFVSPLAEEIRPLFRMMSRLLSLALETTKGVFVENKGLTLSVHYRQMPEEKSGHMKDTFDRVVEDAVSEGKLKVHSGKKVYELRPAVDWNKGKAISMLMKKYGKGRPDTLPIYLGDDLTDEDGFDVISLTSNGLSIHIGSDTDASGAYYYLKSPDEVRDFLEKLLEYAGRIGK